MLTVSVAKESYDDTITEQSDVLSPNETLKDSKDFTDKAGFAPVLSTLSQRER